MGDSLTNKLGCIGSIITIFIFVTGIASYPELLDLIKNKPKKLEKPPVQSVDTTTFKSKLPVKEPDSKPPLQSQPRSQIPTFDDEEALKTLFPDNNIYWDEGQYCAELKSEVFEDWNYEYAPWFVGIYEIVELKIIYSATFYEHSKHKLIFFFRTQPYGLNENVLSNDVSYRTRAPIGGALFTFDKKWKLDFIELNFMQLGAFGVYVGDNKPELTKIGPDKYGFVFKENYVFGEQGGQLFILVTHFQNKIKKVFSMHTEENYYGPQGSYVEKGEISFISGKNPTYYDLKYVLTTNTFERKTTIYQFRDEEYQPTSE